MVEHYVGNATIKLKNKNMPELIELYKQKLDEFEIKINQTQNKVQDLELKLNEILSLIKNHRHQFPG